MGRNKERAIRSAVVELLVLEGVDAGEQFTVDGDEVLIGRRLPASAKARGILLKDPTVSSKQAVIRRKGNELVIQHVAGATNPTLVDGRPAQGDPLRVGTRVQIGRVEMEVRASEGMAISDLTQVFSQPDDDETTEVRPVVSQIGQLVWVRGAEAAADRSFPIWSTRTSLGRSRDRDIQIPDIGVSRKHAELRMEGGSLVLVHQSQVNPTLLNGSEVLDREYVSDGDTIQLADSVELRVELRHPGRSKTEETHADAHRRSLKQKMEQRIALDDEIEQRFSVQGSFLDVDVVNSYGMKAETSRADRIVVSFERFRAFVGGVVVEYGGFVLNSNGDELMCYFESTLDAVRAGSQILMRLDGFNGEQNVLPVPFRFRLGIHTGESLVDLDQGVAYSPVLDVAGHLQKLADENALLISDQTLRALPAGLPFERAGVMEQEGFAYYRLVGVVE
ncbi:MAG: FHA domain-containing protein [Deltaproteobacteria bacterium]|nr:FHA domain-containing protein [Deltaproteobacteria bacterium]MBW2384242.1 FHA domain-containing protein [Deltaproteobacteria bacterium]MBW2695907.1 FHA domain-containing protein [Deltaproteobacteria bacterium]